MTLLADARHALRLLGRSPLFAATAVVSLSLGVAASSTVFSVADALTGAGGRGARLRARRRCRPRQRRQRVRQHVAPAPSSTCASTPRPSHGLAAVELGGRPMSLTVGAVERAGLRHAGLGQLLRRPGHPGGARPVLPARRGRRAGRTAGRRAHPPLLDPPPRRRSRACCDRPLRLNNREFAVVGVAEPGFEGVTLAGTDLFVPMAMVAEARGLATAAQLTDVRGVWHIGRGAAAARRFAGHGGGGARHADGAVQGGQPGGQSPPHRRTRCPPAAYRGRCARRFSSSSPCCSC